MGGAQCLKLVDHEILDKQIVYNCCQTQQYIWLFLF
jgi:hypothetical protein